ncbi:MAG: GNAT family N-acetyltransferase [Candidatus Odinarchaeota archaeon]
MNAHENQQSAADLDRLQVTFRQATESDAKAINSLVAANLDVFPGLNIRYTRPSVESWKKSFERGGSLFLDSYILADAVIAGKHFSPAGYARIYRFPAAGGQECGYIRGPWVDPSLDEQLVTTLAREIASKTLEKVKEFGIPLARARVPLLLPSRLSLFRDFLGFVTIDRLYSYGKQLLEEVSVASLSLPGVVFSLYQGTFAEDMEVIELNNTVFPRDRFTAESFGFLKKQYCDFKEGNYIHVARVDGKLAGMVWSGFQQRADGFTVCEIQELAVYPAYQRRGIARALVFHCLQQAREKGIQEVTTTISTFNQPSIRTFESCGFTCQPLTGDELLEKKTTC